MNSRVILELPSEEEVQSTTERFVGSDHRSIRKTIRYRSGMVVSLLQDFRNNIFSVEIRPYRFAKCIGERRFVF